MKAIRFISFFLIFPLLGFSQNLIPNPSFEEHDTDSPQCSTNACGGNLECANGWINPTTFDTPDYFHYSHPSNCSDGGSNSGKSVDVPDNWLGYQHPHTGSGYVGIHTYTSNLDDHEYLKAKLTKPLYSGQAYTFTMYISKADDQVMSSNGLGVYFTVDNYCHQISCYEITRPPHFYIDEVITNTEDWLEYSWTFTAEAAYEYIFLGRFFSNSDPRFIVSGDFNIDHTRASYYIDDLSLIAEEAPPIDLGEDILTCEGYILESPIEAESYLWSTGSTNSSISIIASGEYWLEVERFGEIRRDTIQVDIINESKIYPNPSNGYTNLELSSNFDATIPWKIYDISGKFIVTGKIDAITGKNIYPIDFSNLSSGVYLIQYTNPCGDKILEKIAITR